jgi:L-lactate dehydrogenase (cytochrome)
MRDRGSVRELIQRAIAAGYSTLLPTLDLPVQGQRHCDIKNGMSVPPRLTLANVADVAGNLTWALSIAKARRKPFGNLHGRARGADGITTLAKWMATSV